MPKSMEKAARCCHDAIFQSIDQLFDGRLRSTTATAGHHEAIAHPAVPALNPNKAFAWTAGHGIQAETVGVPVGQITADWNSPVVREALLRKGFQRRAGRLHVQVQGAAAERRDANIHLLRRITDVARRSRWAHFYRAPTSTTR